MTKKNKEVLYTLFMILCLGVFLFSGYQLIKIYFDYHQMEKEHLDLSNKVIQIVEETIEKEEIIEKKETINVDFTTLKERNQDVVGWLYQKDTVINYPVVKCEDNETYVRKDLDKKYSRAGTLFVDFRCNEDVVLIYGHHMLDGSMLASILDYQTQNYYDQHPEMIYCTLQNQYRVELFLGFVTNTEDELYTLQNLDWINERTSDFQTENQYKGGKLLILSTCYKQTGNERYILVGNLIEED